MQTVFYFLIWGAFIFLMMRFGCGAHVMGHGHGSRHESGKPDATAPASGARLTPPAKDEDPVCGMTIETASAKSAVYDGHAYYFCSQNCRDKFEASPQSYTSGAVISHDAMEHKHEHIH